MENRKLDDFFKEKIQIGSCTIEFIDVIFGAIILMLGIVARVAIFDMVSGDYEKAFADWMLEIRNCHTAGLPYIGVEPLGEDHLSTFDYNCLYQYLLVFLNFLSPDPSYDMYLVKFSDCVFDILAAITIGRIIHEITGDVHKSVMAFGVGLVIPTVLLNSAAWAQNDAIYTSFLLLSFLSLLKGRDFRTWLYFAIAFCWKQQAIFFAPVLVIAWLKGRLKIRYVLIVPVMYALVMIPAAIAGMFVPGEVTADMSRLLDTGNVTWSTVSIVNDGVITLHPVGRTMGRLLSVYGNQVAMFTRLTMNYPNIYAILQSGLDAYYRSMIITCGELVTVMLMGILAYYFYNKKIKTNGLMLVTLTVFAAELIVYCLPCMHERYGYVAEVFAFIYAMFGWKRLCIAVAFQGITLVTYTRFLFGASQSLTTQNLVVFAFILMGLIMAVGYDLHKQVQSAMSK